MKLMDQLSNSKSIAQDLLKNNNGDYLFKLKK